MKGAILCLSALLTGCTSVSVDSSREVAAAITILAWLALSAGTALRYRRRAQRAARERATLLAGDRAPVLVAFATQTGVAERLAWQTAEALRQAHIPVRLLSFEDLDAEILRDTREGLFIASTTGEGDAPDSSAPFLRRVMGGDLPMPHMRYAVLALGDSSYQQFCAFGRRLDAWLRHNRAQALFDPVEVDDEDDGALRHWQSSLSIITGILPVSDWSRPTYGNWTLIDRMHMNPGSVGGPIHLVSLRSASDAMQWQAGDIAEVFPGDPDAEPDLPHREYSIASVSADGKLDLVVRQVTRDDGTPGLGSHWLCAQATPGSRIALRIRSNRAFHPPPLDSPLILIGNGTGIAGLRAYLKVRAQAGRGDNWLLFGERHRAHDFLFRAELEQWQDSGILTRLDLAFSRDDGALGRYVQHLLVDFAGEVRTWLDRGAAIYVCGALQGMAGGVDAALEAMIGRNGIDALIEQGRYRRDVY